MMLAHVTRGWKASEDAVSVQPVVTHAAVLYPQPHESSLTNFFLLRCKINKALCLKRTPQVQISIFSSAPFLDKTRMEKLRKLVPWKVFQSVCARCCPFRAFGCSGLWCPQRDQRLPKQCDIRYSQQCTGCDQRNDPNNVIVTVY